jgi:hypothetical protein
LDYIAYCIQKDEDARVLLVTTTVEGGDKPHFEALHIAPGPCRRIANSGAALEVVSFDASFLTPKLNAAMEGIISAQDWAPVLSPDLESDAGSRRSILEPNRGDGGGELLRICTLVAAFPKRE